MCYSSLVWDVILSFVWGTLIALMFHICFVCLKKIGRCFSSNEADMEIIDEMSKEKAV